MVVLVGAVLTGRVSTFSRKTRILEAGVLESLVYGWYVTWSPFKDHDNAISYVNTVGTC